MNIPISHSTESLERFFQHMLDAPIPNQVSVHYLKNERFVSGHDPEIRLILRLLGFLTNEDIPTQLWHDYKEQGKPVVQEAIKKFYKDLFILYPDAASSRNYEDLAQWFKQFNKTGARTSTERAIRTFRKLCNLADITPAVQTVSPKNVIDTATPLPLSGSGQSSKSVQILLPESTNTDVYRAIFEAFKETWS